MKRRLLLIVVLATACATRTSRLLPETYSDIGRYREARAQLIQQERARRLGGDLIFTADEEAANRRLMSLKQNELERTRGYFPPAHSFLADRTKQAIAASRVFEVMRRLPKGGVLHAHGSALGDYRWLTAQAIARPDTYIYAGPASPTILPGALRVSEKSPGDGWRLVSELRAAAPDQRAFDEQIFQSITLGQEDLDSLDIWQEFASVFRRTSGLIGHRAVQADYWRNTLEGLIDENIQYLESRTTAIDEAIVKEARSRDPDFDVKFIPAGGRSNSRERLAQILKTVVELRVKDPGRIKGFDLVEEEDRTQTNLFYIEELLAARRDAERQGVTLPFYLHSGESNWAENENLYDAILLGAPRIGHGLALIKHPLLMDIVRERNVAIEVCPISNQILGYVSDLRNHPGAHYINAGLAVVLSPDDPGIMRHSLSHDFYAAFMAWGLDLRSLKQLAMNSLLHSTMSPDEKQRALRSWERRWLTFVSWLNTIELQS